MNWIVRKWYLWNIISEPFASMINAMHPFILASYLNTHRITHFNSMTKVSKVLLQLNRIELLYPLQSFTAKTFHQINFGAFLRSQKTHLINLEMKIIYPYLIYTFVKLAITNCGSNWSVFFRLFGCCIPLPLLSFPSSG